MRQHIEAITGIYPGLLITNELRGAELIISVIGEDVTIMITGNDDHHTDVWTTKKYSLSNIKNDTIFTMDGMLKWY